MFESQSIWYTASAIHLSKIVKAANLVMAVWSEVVLFFAALAGILGVDFFVSISESVVVWHANYIMYFGGASLMFLVGMLYRYVFLVSQLQDTTPTKWQTSFFVQSLIGFTTACVFIFISVFLGILYTLESVASLFYVMLVIATVMGLIEFRLWYLLSFVQPYQIPSMIVRDVLTIFILSILGMSVYLGLVLSIGL